MTAVNHKCIAKNLKSYQWWSLTGGFMGYQLFSYLFWKPIHSHATQLSFCPHHSTLKLGSHPLHVQPIGLCSVLVTYPQQSLPFPLPSLLSPPTSLTSFSSAAIASMSGSSEFITWPFLFLLYLYFPLNSDIPWYRSPYCQREAPTLASLSSSKSKCPSAFWSPPGVVRQV